MSLPVEFHPAVRGELDTAHAWYESKRAGLGDDFLDAVGRLVAEVAANPARFGFARRDIREGLLNQFPYAVYYRELPDRLRVVAVHHTARDPAAWQSRN